jgi:hypothetical protein
MSGIQLTAGSHEFESLGFEDCCDGHAELEVHLPCDTSVDPWRVVVAGEAECLRCNSIGNAVSVYKFSNADSVGVVDSTGSRHGTISGAPTSVVDNSGVANEAMMFTFGNSEFITVPTPYVASDQDFSIEVVLKPTTWDAAFHGFVGYQADNTRSPSMWVASERDQSGGVDRGLHWDVRTTQNGDGTRFFGVEMDWFKQDTYVHVAWTKSTSTDGTGACTFYKNGALVITAVCPQHVDLHAEYWIGRVDNFFGGVIDQVGPAAAHFTTACPLSSAADVQGSCAYSQLSPARTVTARVVFPGRPLRLRAFG